MAQRRMFSPQIVDSDAFLDMPPTSQLLYFHLSMRADDDGFVGNPKKILRMIGGNDDDLKILIGKRFLLIFQSGVVVIKHWKIHNLIRSDRYHETKYLDEKKTLLVKDNGSYSELATKWQPDVTQLAPEVRLGKVRLVNTSEPSSQEVFNFEEELEKLRTSGRKDHKIIALYWKKKGWKFENRAQFNGALKRELRPAKDLTGYTGIQISQAIIHCQKNYTEWSLETCGKRINDVITKHA